MEFFYIVAGLVLLIAGGDYLVRGASGIAIKLKITPMLVGMTVVAMGTSAPELVVSLQAALAGKADISVGNVVGSNIANISLILGITVLIFPIAVARDALQFDWVIMMLATIAFYLLGLDGSYSRLHGGLFVAALIAYIAFSLVRVRRKERKAAKFDATQAETRYHVLILLLFVIAGSGAMVLGANWFLTGAESIARNFGVSDRVIAVSLVAFGTSVPELAASVVAAFKKEQDISLGNILGSNLFNVLFIIGTTALITPLTVSEEMISNDYLWMLATSFAVLPLCIFGMRLSRLAGLILVGSYVAFIYFLLA